MTNLTKTAVFEEKTTPQRQDYPMKAGAVTRFEGGLSAFDTAGNGRFLVKGANTANFLFAGLNVKQVVQESGGSDGDNLMRVIPRGSGNWVRMKSGSALTQANQGDTVYLVDDELINPINPGNTVVVGIIRIVEDAEFCFVEI